jgi:hypothetical protein
VSYPLSDSDLAEDIQRDSVAVVEMAMKMSGTIHVPAILLSASAEFENAYGPAGNRSPSLSSISEDDPRVRASYWYQPLVNTQTLGHHNCMPRIIFAAIIKLIFFRSETVTRPPASIGCSPNRLRSMSEIAEDLQNHVAFIM